MASKFVGRDAQVYSIDGTVLLGRWETIVFKPKKYWADVTSSDAVTPEKRKMMDGVSATLKNWIDTTGSLALLEPETRDKVTVIFTEINSGRTAILNAGIMDGEAAFSQESGKDTIELETVGLNPDGSFPFSYI